MLTRYCKAGICWYSLHRCLKVSNVGLSDPKLGTEALREVADIKKDGRTPDSPEVPYCLYATYWAPLHSMKSRCRFHLTWSRRSLVTEHVLYTSAVDTNAVRCVVKWKVLRKFAYFRFIGLLPERPRVSSSLSQVKVTTILNCCYFLFLYLYFRRLFNSSI